MGQFRTKQRVCTRTRGNDSAASSELGTRHHHPIPLPCNSPEGPGGKRRRDTRGPRKKQSRHQAMRVSAQKTPKSTNR